MREELLLAARSLEAVPLEADEYGKRYMLDFEMSTETGSARVRSGWIVRSGEDFPRFTSCWVLQEDDGTRTGYSRRGGPH